MTLATAVTDTRRVLQDEPVSDSFSTAPTGTTGTSIVVGTTGLWTTGDVMEFSLDGEQALVTDDSSDPTLTIVRAHNETTAGTHTTAERILKNPTYGTVEIQEALNFVLDYETWPQVFQFDTTTFTPDPGNTIMYDLPADYEMAVDLVQEGASLEDLRRIGFEERLNVPTAISTTLKALRVTSWPRTDVDATLTYIARITSSSFPSDYEPIAALGAAARLLRTQAREEARSGESEDVSFRILRVARETAEEEYKMAKASYRAQLLPRLQGVRRFRRRARMIASS